MKHFTYLNRIYFESPYNITLRGLDTEGRLIEGPPLKDVLGMTEAEAITANAEFLRSPLHAARQASRTQAETGGFVFNGHPIDSDRDSILRIGNAATTALTAQLTGSPFSTTWSCADEYQMTLDAAGVMALQAALSAHGLACHLRSQELKALIDAPDADLDALADVISTGWPGPA